MSNQTHFIVQTAAACMPSSCWGNYGKVAVLEVDRGLKRVSMISTHAKGCHKVIDLWDRQHCGKTERSAFHRAQAAAIDLASKLNTARDLLTAYGCL